MLELGAAAVIFECDGLRVGPRVVLTETAVAKELIVEIDELLVNELADMVTGTEDTICWENSVVDIVDAWLDEVWASGLVVDVCPV